MSSVGIACERLDEVMAEFQAQVRQRVSLHFSRSVSVQYTKAERSYVFLFPNAFRRVGSVLCAKLMTFNSTVEEFVQFCIRAESVHASCANKRTPFGCFC